MRVIRDRGDARWLPSRFHFALFRLLAYIRLQMAKPEPRPGVVLALQRDQNPFETFFLTASVLAVGTAFTATLLDERMSLPAAILVAFMATAAFMQVMIVAVGLIVLSVLRRASPAAGEKRLAMTSAIQMLITIAIATLLAMDDSPLRHVGTVFLAGVAANAIAALIVLAMARPIADAERRFGVQS